MFNHHAFRDEMGLSGVNSINWARIVAQVVYYFTAAVSLGGPHRPVSFSVPTGNFGDVLAGWVAKRMGLPMGRLNVATNTNDILARTLETGRYEITRRGADVLALHGHPGVLELRTAPVRGAWPGWRGRSAHDGVAVAMASPSPSTDGPMAALRRDFSASAVREDAVAAEMGATWRDAGYLLDPHTAIGVASARGVLRRDPSVPVVALGTAHPGQVPRRGAGRDRRRPPLPAAPCGPLRARRAFLRAAQ